ASSNKAFTGIDVWDVENPDRHTELSADGPLLSILPNDKGPYVASDVDKKLYFWDISTLSLRQTAPLNAFRTCDDSTTWFVRTWTWNPQGNQLWKLCGTNDPLHAEPPYAQVFNPLRRPEMIVKDAAVAAHGDVVLVSDRSQGLVRWDMRGGPSAV